ncbi:MAG: DUF2199 domain-containing protein [Gammaproteobacteria bacterium]|nr:DUF2199 domain-containing protein [Gammaproteobacteria bacterium]
MDRFIRFTCGFCGKVHEGGPSVAYKAPDSCHAIPEDQRGDDTRLQADFCMVEARDYFIRCTLEIPILDSDDTFMWGVWLRVAYADFIDYWEHFEEYDRQGRYAGWLGNRLPVYPDTLELAGWAILQPDGKRPIIELDATEHPLSIDFHVGISWNRAVDIAGIAMHRHDA